MTTIIGTPEANAIIDGYSNPEQIISLIKDVISGLPDVSSVSLQHIIPGRSGAVVFLASTISFGSPDIPVIIKVGPIDLLSMECSNYDSFVARKLRTAPQLLPLRPTHNKTMAIAYGLAGWTKSMHHLITYKDHFHKTDSDFLVSTLLPILNDLESWWGVAKPVQMKAPMLYDIYSSEVLKESLGNSLADSKYSSFLIDDPLALLDIWEYLKSSWPIQSTLTAIVHADVNATNILFDLEHNRTALIDFASVKPNGHIFMDLAKLEREIRCRLIGQEHDDFEKHLLEMEYLESEMSFFLDVPALCDVNQKPRSETYYKGYSALTNIYLRVRTFFEKFYQNEGYLVSEFYLAVFFQTLIVTMFEYEEYAGQKIASINSCFRMFKRIQSTLKRYR